MENFFEFSTFKYDLLLPYIRSIDISKILGGVVTGCTVYVLYKTLRIYLLRRKYKHILGPCTKGILGFYFGNLIEIQKQLSDGKIYVEILNEWRKQYGDVFKFQMFDEIVVVTTDKEAVKEVLVTKNFPKRQSFIKLITFPYNERFLGFGLITDNDNERWRHRRAIFNHGFHKNVLITFVKHFNTKVDILMERLRTLADGKKTIKLFPEMNHLTLDAIAIIAFGMNIDSINLRDHILSEKLTRLLEGLNEALFDPFITYKPHKYGTIKEIKSIIRNLRQVGREKILERLKAFENNEHVPDDILSNILKSFKDSNLDLEMMVDDFISFLIAGQETTANTLSFCFLEIGNNKSIYEKAREEVDRVLGARTEITYQDVNELKYCSSIFKEALRIYPPVSTLDKETTHEILIDGLKIPANSHLIISTFLSGRHEGYFNDPLVFRPERFMRDADSIENSIESYTYFPFSVGPRKCIGQNFAQIEGIIAIAKFVQNFDLKLDPAESKRLAQHMTLHPADGTLCVLSCRS